MATCVFGCNLGLAMPTELIDTPKVIAKILFASNEYEERPGIKVSNFWKPLKGQPVRSFSNMEHVFEPMNMIHTFSLTFSRDSG